MKRMNYSSLTATIRRIHNATSQSKKTGIPVKEILDQDRELVRQLHNQRLENSERRKFLRSLGAIGAGVAMSGISHKSEAINLLNGSSGNDPRIAIIGAGAGGMRTAHRLQQYGILSKVYEARNRVGGRMYSKQPLHGGSAFFPGRVLETGGEFISSEHTALRNLVHQLNLQLEDQNKLAPGEEEVYLVNGMLYNENDLMDEWVGGLYETMKSALKDAPWQPLYNNQHTPEHIQFDTMTAREWLINIGYDQGHWVHELLMTDLVSEYGLLEENSALNLVYLLGWNVRGGGGLPLAGTDERFTVAGGNDQVIHAMADELPEDTIETGRALTAIVGNSEGPYTLVF
ncbi:MAG: FAD-dependent oxidoreductase, partial [Gammaproteobacteria bacterium]|nr:FAD-dependent oxidoreductase [Gammaproteobacteria bacterium]